MINDFLCDKPRRDECNELLHFLYQVKKDNTDLEELNEVLKEFN